MKTRFPNFVLLCVLALAVPPIPAARADAPSGVSADVALQRLMEGNKRFVAGKPTHDRQGEERRAEVAKGQKPFAIVVCCSDSRVSPEITFDQGLGDIFVSRTAGNVVDDVALGGVEYAVAHFGPQLIIVVGHSHCGAVSAALKGGEVPGHIGAVVDAIKPAIAEAKDESGDKLENAVRANVRYVVKQLQTTSPILSEQIKAGKLKIVGACYDLKDGTVTPVP